MQLIHENDFQSPKLNLGKHLFIMNVWPNAEYIAVKPKFSFQHSQKSFVQYAMYKNQAQKSENYLTITFI